MIPINIPFEPDLESIHEKLKIIHKNKWYTNFGPFHEELTVALEKYLGVKNLLLVSNATVGLQVAYKALNVKFPLMTPFSFIATSKAAEWVGLNIDYSDIDPVSLNLCPVTLNKNIKNEHDAIVATHVYGNPCDVIEIERIAKKNNVKVIYDAAHAFGIEYCEQSVLNYGDASVISFHATKLFHTIEGGAIIFKDRNDYIKAKKMINFSVDNWSESGTNGKLNEYQSAVGLDNLKYIDEVLSHRRKLYKLYKDSLTGIVQLQSWNDSSTFNGAYFPIILKNEEELLSVSSILHSKGVNSRRYFWPTLNQFHNSAIETTNSNDISSRILCLPLYYYLKEADVIHICKLIKGILK
jgi:dTDP-4-amino-4,6-dideoxygalactose transaminase